MFLRLAGSRSFLCLFLVLGKNLCWETSNSTQSQSPAVSMNSHFPAAKFWWGQFEDCTQKSARVKLWRRRVVKIVFAIRFGSPHWKYTGMHVSSEGITLNGLHVSPKKLHLNSSRKPDPHREVVFYQTPIWWPGLPSCQNLSTSDQQLCARKGTIVDSCPAPKNNTNSCCHWRSKLASWPRIPSLSGQLIGYCTFTLRIEGPFTRAINWRVNGHTFPQQFETQFRANANSKGVNGSLEILCLSWPVKPASHLALLNVKNRKCFSIHHNQHSKPLHLADRSKEARLAQKISHRAHSHLV